MSGKARGPGPVQRGGGDGGGKERWTGPCGGGAAGLALSCLAGTHVIQGGAGLACEADWREPMAGACRFSGKSENERSPIDRLDTQETGIGVAPLLPSHARQLVICETTPP